MPPHVLAVHIRDFVARAVHAMAALFFTAAVRLRLPTLRNPDFVAGAIHATSAFALGLAQESARDSSVVLSTGETIRPIVFAALAAFWSSLVHNATATMFSRNHERAKPQPTALLMGTEPDPEQEVPGTAHEFAMTRYVDYVVSASLMVVPAGVYMGVRSLGALLVAVGSMACTMVMAHFCEKLAARGKENRWMYRVAVLGYCAAQAIDMQWVQEGFTLAIGAIGFFLPIALIVSFDCGGEKMLRIVVVGASFVAYGCVWTSLWAARESGGPNNGLMVFLLVASHAVFGPLFAYDWQTRASPKAHDIRSTACSVFAKTLMHWLVYANSPTNDPPTDISTIAPQVAMSCALALIVWGLAQ